MTVTPAEPDKVDVAIIGAGISGLVAARRLLASGLRVQILEARSRVGGRLCSVTDSSGSALDMGRPGFGRGNHVWPS